MKKEGIYLFFVTILNTMGNFSVYSTAVFSLTRSWQGKGILAGFLIPAMIYLVLKGWNKNQTFHLHTEKLVLMGLSMAMVSSMGIMFFPLMLGVFGLIGAGMSKNFRILVKGALCCVPSVILAVIHLILRGGGL